MAEQTAKIAAIAQIRFSCCCSNNMLESNSIIFSSGQIEVLLGVCTKKQTAPPVAACFRRERRTDQKRGEAGWVRSRTLCSRAWAKAQPRQKTKTGRTEDIKAHAPTHHQSLLPSPSPSSSTTHAKHNKECAALETSTPISQ